MADTLASDAYTHVAKRVGRSAGSRSAGAGGRRRRGGAHDAASDAAWRAVVDMLGELEVRQSAARAELADLRGACAKRAAQTRQLECARAEEVAGLRAANAVATVEFRRQSRALAQRVVAAGRQAKRARSVATQARSAVSAARADADASRAELQGALSALAAKTSQDARLRSRVQELERQLAEATTAAAAARDQACTQSKLLDEAAAVIQKQLRRDGVTAAGAQSPLSQSYGSSPAESRRSSASSRADAAGRQDPERESYGSRSSQSERYSSERSERRSAGRRSAGDRSNSDATP
eukprot:TRINITY_DN2787_c0_g1_i1.p1 TRINITY_DN2787_c0_g1~~TRINITY_DN2787_c0_g1_i1.p1  ORF type:complete len:295 (+),score=53.56 TRINITY_DN2787_c0_g1_i1:204-1088(+)